MRLPRTAAALLAAVIVMTSVPRTTAEFICTLSGSESCAVESLTPSDDDGSVLI
ncbi:hypothetical protein PF008_g21894 [Phytophthora fragariae]|uniref:RxLR effector protein n=1 Tax=Phytophthora fragariae TaxID=53985 RepID=A0A6G0QVI4_9STRA|nr:hypothetical protein PF008_g21894 [Phytophthora fragariae]